MKRSSILFLVLTACMLAFSAAAAEGIAISGRVLVPGGAPLPQADVQLLPLLDPLGKVGSVLTEAELEPVSRALTSSEGRFRLEAPHAGLWTVRVQAPGFAPLETDLQPLIEPVELPDAELATDTGMKIKIKSVDGSPIPGALVLLRSDLSRIPFFRSPWNIPLRSGRTDAEGKLRLRFQRRCFAMGHDIADAKPPGCLDVEGKGEVIAVQGTIVVDKATPF